MVSSMTLKMEAICFSDMLADFQQAAERALHNLHCENIKSCVRMINEFRTGKDVRKK
jgi:hypothetical protein